MADEDHSTKYKILKLGHLQVIRRARRPEDQQRIKRIGKSVPHPAQVAGAAPEPMTLTVHKGGKS